MGKTQARTIVIGLLWDSSPFFTPETIAMRSLFHFRDEKSDSASYLAAARPGCLSPSPPNRLLKKKQWRQYKLTEDPMPILKAHVRDKAWM